MNVDKFFNDEFSEHEKTVAATRDVLRVSFKKLLAACVKSIQAGGKIVFFGNGGSASDAQHLATELTIRYIANRAPIAAIALNTDTSALTATGNDLGFDQIFARQVNAICKPEDIIIGISTSGNSENVIKGLQAAKALGCVTAGFGGKDGGPMRAIADPFLIVPSTTTSRIQEVHIIIGHMLCGALELELKLV